MTGPESTRRPATQPEPLRLQSCAHCGIGSLCLSGPIIGGDLQDLKPVVKRRFNVVRGETLYLAGQSQQAVYVVRSGSLKVYEIDADGGERVAEFFLPGDVIGLEDIESGCHEGFAQALENSWVCEIPLSALRREVFTQAPLCQEMVSVLCGKVRKQRDLLRDMGHADAMSRVGGFLIDLSERYRQRRLPHAQFRLSMDRGDIANYLGMKLETVSRCFSSLQRSGLIRVHGKSVQILDRKRLLRLHGPQAADPGCHRRQA